MADLPMSEPDYCEKQLHVIDPQPSFTRAKAECRDVSYRGTAFVANPYSPMMVGAPVYNDEEFEECMMEKG